MVFIDDLGRFFSSIGDWFWSLARSCDGVPFLGRYLSTPFYYLSSTFYTGSTICRGISRNIDEIWSRIRDFLTWYQIVDRIEMRWRWVRDFWGNVRRGAGDWFRDNISSPVIFWSRVGERAGDWFRDNISSPATFWVRVGERARETIRFFFPWLERPLEYLLREPIEEVKAEHPEIASSPESIWDYIRTWVFDQVLKKAETFAEKTISLLGKILDKVW